MKRGFTFFLGLLVASGLAVFPVDSGAESSPRTPRSFFNVGAAVGSPGETVGSAANAGSVYLFRFASPTPVLDTSSPVLLTESSVGGAATPGSLFGAAVALADLDQNGVSDLIIGAPGADAGAGRVYIVFRSFVDGSLRPGTATRLRQGVGGVSGTSEPGDHFGASLYVGYTYDGDPWLAIGAPGEDIGAATNAGSVTVIPAGVRTDKDFTIYQGKFPSPGTAESGDAFGTSIAGFGEAGGIAIGAPGEDIGSAVDTGNVIGLAAALFDLPGTGAGYSFSQGVNGVPGNSESGDHFGAALVTRLANAITVGAPGEDVGTIVNAGAVTDILVPGECCVANTSWYQGGHGILGQAEAGDGFGASLSSTAYGNVIVGAPGEDVGGAVDAGVIHVIRNGMGGGPSLIATDNQVFHQGSPNVPGAAEPGDRFGSSLAGQGPNNVVIGIPGEDVGAANGAGAIVLLRSDGDKINTSLPGQQITQDTPGVASSAESGDFFGGSVFEARSGN